MKKFRFLGFDLGFTYFSDKTSRYTHGYGVVENGQAVIENKTYWHKILPGLYLRKDSYL